MSEVENIINNYIEKNEILKITLSNNKNKNAKFSKIVIEPILKKSSTIYQISYYFDTKVKHENISSNFCSKIIELINLGYKQTDINTINDNLKILTNKKGKQKIITNKVLNKANIKTFHNKQKNYILDEGNPIDFLVELGIMNKEGYVFSDKKKKFKQINKFLEMLESISSYIESNSNIVDIGCGKSYLTFATYYYFNVIKNKSVNIIGLDLKKDVIESCQALANNLNYLNINFHCIDIKDFKFKENIDLCISLHACNTATDYALYNSILWNAKVILSVPCCQHELFQQIDNNSLQPMLKHGIFKERFCAMLTDTIRSLTLEKYGYKSNIIEFIDIEHTPKNTMIKAIKKQNTPTSFTLQKEMEIKEILSTYKVKPTLLNLLEKVES